MHLRWNKKKCDGGWNGGRKVDLYRDVLVVEVHNPIPNQKH